MRGDFVVTTLFDGNFDAIANPIFNQPIAGWSLHSGNNEANQKEI